MAIDEIGTLADRCNVSRGRVIIWEKEGRKVCAVCCEPVIVASYIQPTHVDFRVKTHEARISA
ncbi:hypothetical protein [Edaphobacter modestus]|uniref:Uncharacterized protein n=1 Tax=Edaphobacter modestus TaxID=388466 RepID=A0A4Q7YDN4_9BACT|nr:hypothetical protein [Edaphobacter modestus]RZU35442.1 hypothetical protein BDD14_5491 [Edaphobacter modestus]